MYVCSWFPKHSWNTIVPNPPGCLNELSFASPCNCTTSGTTRVAASAQRAGDSIAASSASATTAMVFINAILTGMSFIMLFVFWLILIQYTTHMHHMLYCTVCLLIYIYIERSYSYSIQHTSCIIYCTQSMQNSLYSNLSHRFAIKKLCFRQFFSFVLLLVIFRWSQLDLTLD